MAGWQEGPLPSDVENATRVGTADLSVGEYSNAVLVKFGLEIICDLSMPSEGAHFELLIATFLFEIGSSYS